ncbi:tRNA (adenine(22)-N(1))-methyltransferase [Clostridium thailandense]|uniref:tRNA (adenine(22)-N(1))-methyltransferase n=1 Tax=Clostridium thailandense TaxID=2794346 RepID=UPI003988E68C
MEISLRLKTIASMVDSCECVADIGTDHGYIPIYLVKNDICSKAIASDINKGPVEKAKINVKLEGLENKIQCRLGGGLTTIKSEEVQGIVIAGMGGNLIRDIIEDGIDVFKKAKFAVLQPVQNPEVLREYIYTKGYKIIDEELCIEDNKLYEIVKICYDRKTEDIDSIYYEIGKTLIEKRHALANRYIEMKIERYIKILENITEESESAKNRKLEVKSKIEKLEEMLECL